MTRTTRFTTNALATIAMLSASIAVAQQTDKQPATKTDRQAQQSADDQQQSSQPQNDQQQIEIPPALQKLDLTSEQKQNIKQAIRSENQKLKQAWQQFNQAHYRAIELEAAWVAAVRDTLSEEDQQKFDQQRMQQREMTKQSRHDARQQTKATRRQDRKADRSDDQASNPNDKSDAKSADASGKSKTSDRQQQTASDRQGGSSDSQAGTDQNGQEEEFFVITIVSPERFVAGANQSGEQQQQCSKVCQDYKQQLRKAWNDMHRLHDELVQLEADRFEAIEKQLTKDQLKELKDNRQQPSKTTASVDSAKTSNRQ